MEDKITGIFTELQDPRNKEYVQYFFNSLLVGIKENDRLAKAFAEFFWRKSSNGESTLLGDSQRNGDQLIEMVNTEREIYSLRYTKQELIPYIYCVLVKTTFMVGKSSMKLVKVGFTESNTDVICSRMTQLEGEINRHLKENGTTAVTILVTPINALDTRKKTAVEDWARKKVGYCVDKEIIEKLYLPVKTEWVLTTQKRIDALTEIKRTFEGKKNYNTSVQYEEFDDFCPPPEAYTDGKVVLPTTWPNTKKVDPNQEAATPKAQRGATPAPKSKTVPTRKKADDEDAKSLTKDMKSMEVSSMKPTDKKKK